MLDDDLDINLVGVKKVPGGHHYVGIETKDDEMLPDRMAADKAIELLGMRAKDKKPFFLAVGFVRPHFPFVAPQEDFQKLDVDKMRTPNVPENDADDVPKQSQGPDIKADHKTRQAIRQAYYACVSYMDSQLGRLLKSLDDLGLRENTIIVFASDHGYLLGEHRQWKKHRLWEEAITAPLIISAPNQKSRGVECQRKVELIDIFPTVTELAGLPSHKGAQGISLVNLLNDPKADSKRIDAYSHTTVGHCLRSGKWAYMWYPKQKKNSEGFMLYNMEKDREQYTNLASNPEYDEIKKKLHKRLLERIKESKK